MKEKEQKARELMRTSYETAVGGTVSRRGLEETGSASGSEGEVEGSRDRLERGK